LAEQVEYEVTKAIIVVVGTTNHYLMSMKRDPGSSNDSKLEFLGGRMEADDPHPVAGIVRELAEEEATGRLADIVQARSPLHVQQQIQTAMHYLFPLQITESDFKQLRHDPLESYGFRLVNSHHLQRCDQSYTRKTNRIIEMLDLPVARTGT
jgi:hypothetical protein